MSDTLCFPKLMTVGEAAERLKVTPATIVRWGRDPGNCLTIFERRGGGPVKRFVGGRNLDDYLEETTTRFEKS